MANLTVHHEKLGINFSIKIDAETFKIRRDDSTIECFDSDGNCRKFIKSYLTLTGQTAEQPKKTKKKKSIFDPKEPVEAVPEEEILDDVKKEIDPDLLAGE
jgi:hypothetical protein